MSSQDPEIFRDSLIFPAALDPDAVKIIRRLKRHGHVAYLVGGCVRDLLLGAIPKDFDVATSARPQQIRKLFRNCKIIGRRFRLAHIIFRDKIIEVSTFRKPPPDSDADDKEPERRADDGDSGRGQGDSKRFKTDGLLILRDNVYGGPHDDAVRRDFTVNSLFYDVDDHIVIDYTGGYSDISKRVLRTIGDAHIRLSEDPIRILRAIKFSCRLDLRIEPGQVAAMREHVPEIGRSAPPRVKEDILRILSCGAARKALCMLLDLDVFRIIFPALQETLDREAAYYGTSLPGREFLQRLAHTMDKIDRGRRKHSDALFLAIILSHHVGVCLHDTMERGTPIHDRAGFIDDIIRPIAAPMGVSRREMNMIKQIFNAYPRFERKTWRGRPRPNEFIRRDYFYESLIFYRLVAQGFEKDPSFHDHWLNKFEESRMKRGQDGSGGKTESTRRRPRRRDKRRPRRGSARDNPGGR